MLGWLSNPPRSMSKIADVGSKSYQVGAQNPLKSVPRGLLEGSWGSQEASWRGLGGILGPRGPQDRKMLQNLNSGFPSWGPSWGPKSTKNRSWGDTKGDHFLYRFLDRFLEPIGANLATFWPPKPSQNEAKLAPKSIQVGVVIWELFSDGCWHNCYWFSYVT